MRSNEYLWDVCVEMYREMYAKADPPADFDKLMETGEAKQERFFRNYYLPKDQCKDIYDKICKRHKLTEREKAKVSFAVHLGAAPTSVKPADWDNEEN